MRWRARYVDDDGRERSKQFARKIDAQRWLDNDVTAKLATGTYLILTPGASPWPLCMRHGRRPRGTLRVGQWPRKGVWVNRVSPVFGDMAVVDVKSSAVRAWVTTMVADELGVATIENAFSVLRQVLALRSKTAALPATRATA